MYSSKFTTDFMWLAASGRATPFYLLSKKCWSVKSCTFSRTLTHPINGKSVAPYAWAMNYSISRSTAPTTEPLSSSNCWECMERWSSLWQIKVRRYTIARCFNLTCKESLIAVLVVYDGYTTRTPSTSSQAPQPRSNSRHQQLDYTPNKPHVSKQQNSAMTLVHAIRTTRSKQFSTSHLVFHLATQIQYYIGLRLLSSTLIYLCPEPSYIVYSIHHIRSSQNYLLCNTDHSLLYDGLPCAAHSHITHYNISGVVLQFLLVPSHCGVE